MWTFIAAFILLADTCIQIDLRSEAENNPGLQLYFCETDFQNFTVMPEQLVPIRLVEKNTCLKCFCFFISLHVVKVFYPSNTTVISQRFIRL